MPSIALFSASLALLARAVGEEPLPWALEGSALLCGLAEAIGAPRAGSEHRQGCPEELCRCLIQKGPKQLRATTLYTHAAREARSV